MRTTSKPRKLGKRQMERANKAFVSAVLAELADHGAVFDGTFHHVLETRAGRLLAMPVASCLGPGGFVGFRFEDVERAKAVLGYRGELNPYSGKWNLHLYGEEFGEGCEDRIRAALRLKLETIVERATRTEVSQG